SVGLRSATGLHLRGSLWTTRRQVRHGELLTRHHRKCPGLDVVIPSEESLPIAAGRTRGLAKARSIAEAALRAYGDGGSGGIAAARSFLSAEWIVSEVNRKPRNGKPSCGGT